ncbi:MAG: ASCH domain-containing protein [Candidatus Nitrosocaldus sp.]|nr:ASCH domain-containing protein [Candidatus Nitrosocaldus sp.]MDW8274976.1 ASCH domain-containing protein [Candidatus Nitrosocaldus sp.]
MLLFNRHLVKLIVSGRKVETRRVWKRCIVKPGNVYTASTDYSRKGIFAHLYIRYVKRQRLGEMSDRDAMLEGFSSLEEFRDVWIRCYGKDSWNPMLEVYVIGFSVVDATVAERCGTESPLPLQGYDGRSCSSDPLYH